MDRRKSDSSGFTLLEVLLVLFIISTLMLSMLVLTPRAGLSLNFQMRMLREHVLEGQGKALQRKERVEIIFSKDTLQVGESVFPFLDGMHCTPASFHFTEKGTISRAGSVTCSLQEHRRRVVFQLGSGQSDIR